MGAALDVQWPAVSGKCDHGKRVIRYTVAAYKDSSLIASMSVTPTPKKENPVTAEVTDLTNSDSYTFTVTATNEAGTSPPSPPSAPTTVFGQPATVTDLSAANHQNGQTTLSFTPPDNNGQNISSYNYREDGGTTQMLAGDDVVAGLTNGQTYTFEIQACNTYCGSWSNSASAEPDTAPTAPTPSGSFSNPTFTFSWDAGTSHGCPITTMGWSNNDPNGPWNSSPLTGDIIQIGGTYSETISIYVHVQDSCGLSSTSSGSVTSPPHSASVTVSEGKRATSICGSCRWVDWKATGFTPDTAYNWSCADNDGTFWGPGSAGYEELTTNRRGDVTDKPSANSVAEDCAEGYAGRTVTVTFGGVTSPGYVWP
jgi:hypothetical protein